MLIWDRATFCCSRTIRSIAERPSGVTTWCSMRSSTTTTSGGLLPRLHRSQPKPSPFQQLDKQATTYLAAHWRRGVTYQCGLNVLPVSISVLRRERMRGQPSAQEAYAASSSAHWSWVTETWLASLSGTSSIVTREVLLEEPMANVYCKE